MKKKKKNTFLLIIILILSYLLKSPLKSLISSCAFLTLYCHCFCYHYHYHCRKALFLKSESIAYGKPSARSCLQNLSIIMSSLSTYHQPSFLVVISIVSTNRDEVESQLLRHYQTSPRGNNRRLINLSLKIHYIYYLQMSLNAIKSIMKYTWLRILLRQSGDIESNPGPNTMGSLTLTTLNVRGLKKESKLKQLLNRLHKQSNQNSSVIITLQETHLEHNNLKYTWSAVVAF